jgi:hypothetical protein
LCFAADGVNLEIAGDGHPTAAAYRVAARYVAQETQKLALRSVAIADTCGR